MHGAWFHGLQDTVGRISVATIADAIYVAKNKCCYLNTYHALAALHDRMN
jgi:hypothetical protein